MSLNPQNPVCSFYFPFGNIHRCLRHSLRRTIKTSHPFFRTRPRQRAPPLCKQINKKIHVFPSLRPFLASSELLPLPLLPPCQDSRKGGDRNQRQNAAVQCSVPLRSPDFLFLFPTETTVRIQKSSLCTFPVSSSFCSLFLLFRLQGFCLLPKRPLPYTGRLNCLPCMILVQ